MDRALHRCCISGVLYDSTFGVDVAHVYGQCQQTEECAASDDENEDESDDAVVGCKAAAI